MKYAVYVFTPLCRAFYGTTFSFLFVVSVSRQMVNRSFLLLREVYFVAEGKSLQAWIYFFCLMGTFFPDVACVVFRLFGLSFDGVVLYSLYALVVGIVHLSQCNKGLKIVWIKTKLAASADNSHFSFLSERQLPCLADIGSVLPAAVFNPPCRGISTSYLPWHPAISVLHGCFKVSHVPSPCCSEFLRIASSLSKKSLSGCVFGRDGDSLYILIDLTTCLVYLLQVLQR